MSATIDSFHASSKIFEAFAQSPPREDGLIAKIKTAFKTTRLYFYFFTLPIVGFFSSRLKTRMIHQINFQETAILLLFYSENKIQHSSCPVLFNRLREIASKHSFLEPLQSKVNRIFCLGDDARHKFSGISLSSEEHKILIETLNK